MDFIAKLQTANKTVGINTKDFIIVHHTGTKEKSINGVLNTLTKGSVSCHFVIDENGGKYKIGDPDDILWHCGTSSRKLKKDAFNSMNSFSIGIEVIGPLSNGGFTDNQRKSVKELILHLMKTYGIKKENILRHENIAPGRKTDINKSFREPEFKSWEDWKNAKLKNIL